MDRTFPNIFVIFLWLGLLGCGCAVWGDELQQAQQEYTKAVRPLLQKHCFACHDSENREAELDLQQYQTGAQAMQQVTVWENVLRRVQRKEMPPKGCDPVSNEELDLMLRWLNRVKK